MTQLIAGLIGFAFGWTLRNFIESDMVRKDGGPMFHHVKYVGPTFRFLERWGGAAWRWTKDKLIFLFLIAILIVQLVTSHDRDQEKKDAAMAARQFSCVAKLFEVTLVALGDRSAQSKAEGQASDVLNIAQYNFLVSLTDPKTSKKERTKLYYKWVNAIAQHNAARKDVKKTQAARPFPTLDDVKDCLGG
jgi:hypothetical protein